MRTVLILAVLLAALGFVRAQPADSSLRFESVVVKPGKPPKFEAPDVFGEHEPQESEACVGGPGTPDWRLLKCKVSLAAFIKLSYGLGPLQFAPLEWMESSYWDIEAKVLAEATPQQLRAMEQNLLAERFKLAVHFVKKEVEAYEMTVSKDGPKFKPWDPDVAAAAPARPRIQTAATLQLLQDHTYREASGCKSEERHLRGDLSMQEFARYLTYPDLRLDQPVVDETGLAGFYDIMLDYAARWRGKSEGGIVSFDVTRNPGGCFEEIHPLSPPLIEAVHKELGLVLELTKSTVDVLVVDRAEKKPTKN